MVSKFNTNAPATTGGGSSKTLMIVLGLAVAGFLVYRFVIKPAQDKKKKEEKSSADNQE